MIQVATGSLSVTDEVQTLTLSDTLATQRIILSVPYRQSYASVGEFYLRYGTANTACIPQNAPATAVETAIESLSDITDVTVTKLPQRMAFTLGKCSS